MQVRIELAAAGLGAEQGRWRKVRQMQELVLVFDWVYALLAALGSVPEFVSV